MPKLCLCLCTRVHHCLFLWLLSSPCYVWLSLFPSRRSWLRRSCTMAVPMSNSVLILPATHYRAVKATFLTLQSIRALVPGLLAVIQTFPLSQKLVLSLNKVCIPCRQLAPFLSWPRSSPTCTAFVLHAILSNLLR